MIIACDVDGVIAALHEEWYRRYNRDYGDNLTMDRVLSWDTYLYVKPECGKRIYDYLRDSDLYDHVPVMDGAVAGVRRLRELGHEVVFATSCFENMTDQKAEWLKRHGFILPGTKPGFLPDDMVVLNNKRYVDADILIDDRAETIKDWVERKNRSAVLFEYPHNQSLDLTSFQWQRVKRVQNWNDIVRHFELKAA